jgi:hypothetical protein
MILLPLPSIGQVSNTTLQIVCTDHAIDN